MSSIEVIDEPIPNLLPMTGRSKGIHISSVIHDLCIQLGHYEEQESIEMTRMQLGCALEHAIIHRFSLDNPHRFVQLGELEKDGYFGTPDLYDTVDECVDEIKLTWMSSRHEVDSSKLWKYFVQCKSYCHMLGVVKGRLRVVFMNGDYKENRAPLSRVYRATFDEQDLVSNWSMITTHGNKHRERLST